MRVAVLNKRTGGDLPKTRACEHKFEEEEKE